MKPENARHQMKRREFIISTLSAGLALAAGPLYAQAVRDDLQISVKNDDQPTAGSRSPDGHTPIKLFLCGDVMTGRGIDQVLPHPGNPILFEGYMKSATGYVELAEEVNGPIPQPVLFSYIWGDTLAELVRRKPDVRIINLETAVTRSGDVQDKAVNYRMNPDNILCITAAQIDCCVLANNHILDWGDAGLAETLKTLKQADIKVAGAGLNVQEAQKPVEFAVSGKGRVLVFSFGSETSGIPWSWAARADRPGVNLLPDFSAKTVREIRDRIKQVRLPGDIVVASIHWGNNWGYAIPVEQQDFAHGLIDEAAVDVIHGHSSHHVKGIEVYKGKLILYGCGDFLNDYEGISGHEAYRGDLTLMYFVSAESHTGKLVSLSLVPMQIRHFRLNRTSDDDAAWLKNILNREGKKLGTSVEQATDNTLMLRWMLQG
jgi:poly-gamma-glutamate capsule biosynthesis protein CapA/YwtB (metallophosphatase superfamily)